MMSKATRKKLRGDHPSPCQTGEPWFWLRKWKFNTRRKQYTRETDTLTVSQGFGGKDLSCWQYNTSDRKFKWKGSMKCLGKTAILLRCTHFYVLQVTKWLTV